MPSGVGGELPSARPESERGAGNSLAVAGALVGLASLTLGWLTVRPNRLAAGVALPLWQAGGWGAVAGIGAAWLASLAVAVTQRGARRAVLLAVLSNLMIALTFTFSGAIARDLLETQPEFARVSLGAGAWASVCGAYVLVLAARQGSAMPRTWSLVASWSGLLLVTGMLVTGHLDSLSVMQEFAQQGQRFWQELRQHVFLSGASVVAGTVIGIPLGVAALRSRRLEKPVSYFASTVQTVPSLALFGLLIAPLSALSASFPWLRQAGVRGIGSAPAIIALVLYTLLPIVRNTYAGLRHVDPGVIEAGAGMGMTRAQVFRRVEAPLAAPLVLEGVRIAAVQSVGNTAVAALIGAGGLGHFIFQGLGQTATDLIVLGTIPTIALALAVDGAMKALLRLARPGALPGAGQ